jgi:integrase
MKGRLTKQVVDALSARATDYVHWDGVLKGFGVRVRPSGVKSFIAQYRVGGRKTPVRKVTIGTYGKLTVDEARDEARKVLAKAELGLDVAAERAAIRADITVSELADLYIAEGCEHKKPSTIKNDRSRSSNHVKPLLGSRTAGSVTSADIDRAMRDIAAGRTARDEKTGPHGRSIVSGGKGAATQTVRVLSAMFSFAVKRKLRADNPVEGVEKYKTRKSERFLTSPELEALGAAIREAETSGVPWDISEASMSKHAPGLEHRRTTISPHAAAALRLLLFTGARLREILHLRWSEVDFERGLLLLPDSKTGRKTIILNAPALAVLQDLQRIGAYVIAGETAGQKNEKPRSDLKRPWALVSKRAGFEGVRLHDLRHTHASFGAGAGLGLPVIGRLLGHTQAATTARYAHLADDPLRKAADRIAGDLARALGEGTAAADTVTASPRRT